MAARARLALITSYAAALAACDAGSAAPPGPPPGDGAPDAVVLAADADVSPAPPDAAAEDGGAPPGDAALPAADAEPAVDAGASPDAGPPPDSGPPPPRLDDDARLVSDSLPATLQCGRSLDVEVVMENLGTNTWSVAGEQRLGLLVPSDPFSLTGEARVPVGERLAVESGASYTFHRTLAAPTVPGVYVTRMQMVHEHVAWFGPVVERTIEVVEPCIPAPVTCELTASTFFSTVDASIDAFEAEHPELFGQEDFHGLEVLDTRAFTYGLTARIRSTGLDAVVDAWAGDEIMVKASDAASESFDVLTSEGYVRRGSGSYRATCTPAAF